MSIPGAELKDDEIEEWERHAREVSEQSVCSGFERLFAHRILLLIDRIRDLEDDAAAQNADNDSPVVKRVMERFADRLKEQGWMLREVQHVRRVQRLHDNATEVFDALVTLLRECDRPSDDGGAFDSACDYARSIIRRIEAQEGEG